MNHLPLLCCNRFYISKTLLRSNRDHSKMTNERVKKSVEKSKNVLEEKRKIVTKKICIQKRHARFTIIAMNFVQEQLKNTSRKYRFTFFIGSYSIVFLSFYIFYSRKNSSSRLHMSLHNYFYDSPCGYQQVFGCNVLASMPHRSLKSNKGRSGDDDGEALLL